MRGADLVMHTLKQAGVGTVFTLSGNQIMPLFDAAIDAELRLIHVRHEAAAVFMAEAFAQVSGDVGVALVTAAPGFANALSPLIAARASETPVVLLSGDAPLAADGQGAFQELDQAAAARPLCKAAFRARSAAGLGHDVAEAIRIARSGRPGPVHLALPFDLLTATVEDPSLPGPAAVERERAPIDPADVTVIREALQRAERPLILTGPALNRSRSGALLERLTAATGAPVVAMESPRGLKDPALGAIAEVAAAADLVLCLGRQVDFVIGFGRPPAVAEDSRFLVIDAEADALSRARRLLGPRLHGATRADPDLAAEALGAGVQSGKHAGWRERVAVAIAFRGHERPPASPGRPFPWEVGAAVQAVLDRVADPVLIVDGGEFGQWAQATIGAPARVINGPGGAIGGGLPASVGAKLARPGATVVALLGDGTLGFHLAEFETALRVDAPFVLVVGNDARWNAEHQIQLRAFGPGRLIGCDLLLTRYDLAVAGLGGHGEHVASAAELAPALDRALAASLPACLNVEIDGRPAPLFTRRSSP